MRGLTPTLTQARSLGVGDGRCPDPSSRLIAAQTVKRQLPSIDVNRRYAEARGLLRYGRDRRDNSGRAATYVDKILEGGKPGDLPFEQPAHYQLMINGRTAKALGFTICHHCGARRADEVIE